MLTVIMTTSNNDTIKYFKEALDSIDYFPRVLDMSWCCGSVEDSHYQRLMAADAAKTKYVTFLDPDDCFGPNYLTKAIALLEANLCLDFILPLESCSPYKPANLGASIREFDFKGRLGQEKPWVKAGEVYRTSYINAILPRISMVNWGDFKRGAMYLGTYSIIPMIGHWWRVHSGQVTDFSTGNYDEQEPVYGCYIPFNELRNPDEPATNP